MNTYDGVTCPVCEKHAAHRHTVPALFVKRICVQCAQDLGHNKIGTNDFYRRMKGKPDQSYVRAFERGQANPDGIKVTHKFANGTTADGPIELQPSGIPKDKVLSAFLKEKKTG